MYLDKAGNPPSEADQARSLENKDSAKLSEQVENWHRADADTHTQPQDTVESPAKQGIVSERKYPGLRKRFDCRPGCCCSCHVNRNINSPRLLNSVLGEFSIYWRSQKKLEVRCNCSGHTGVAVFYRFPDYIVQRYISVVLEMDFLVVRNFYYALHVSYPGLIYCGDIQSMAISKPYRRCSRIEQRHRTT